MKLFEIKNVPIPSWLLCEAAEGKNVHLEHVEDLVYNEGYIGAQKALNYMEGVRRMFAQGEGEPTKVTVKWDGAPAIICGTDPADGKFFVGTKSVFAKTEPKLCKSLSDIRKFYGEQEGLAAKLSVALKYLKSLGIGNVLQGDLMFTADDLTTANIGGQDCYIFTPNTITYAVPIYQVGPNGVKTETALGRRIRAAKLGIIFHTAYEGSTVADMRASFGASVAGLNATNNVWVDDAFYKDLTGRASLTPAEDARIKNILLSASTTFRKIDEKDFNRIIFTGRTTKSGDQEYTEFANFIKPFINNMVRGGEQVGDPTTFLKNFLTYYNGKQEAEIAKLKGGPDSPAAQARIQKIKEKEKFMADNSNTLLGILAIYKRIIEAKVLLLQKMQQVENIGTFIKTDDGYKVTAPEGFVAIGHDGGAVKLVDRIEFSRQNFSATKSWKK
jgi:hypothetical protein